MSLRALSRDFISIFWLQSFLLDGLERLVLPTPAPLEEPFWGARVSFSSYFHQDAPSKAARADDPTP